MRHCALILGLAAVGCATASSSRNVGTTGSASPVSLKDAFNGAFRVGAAVTLRQVSGLDTQGARIITAHFNTITPENLLKWESVHPQPDVYAFAAADQYVDFGRANRMKVIGHTLVWHNQTPRWVFQDANGAPVGRDVLLQRVRDHIRTVVGRYKGRIAGWDVVNEAIDEDGSLRRSPWLTIIGPDYVAKAFQFAHEADPSAELYYNDYSLENPAKRTGALRLIRELKAQGVPIAAVGLQGHDTMDWPTAAQEDSTIAAFAALGVKVNITELDIDVLPRAVRGASADVSASADIQQRTNPYAAGLPDSVQQALAKRYADLFGVFLAHRDVVDRVTFWGVADGDSWLNNWPIRGRTSYPLLFDRRGRPKPAFDAVIQTTREAALRR